MDADVSDLPESRQADIGRYLKRTGSDGRDTYNAVADVDSDAAQTLVEIENPVVQRQFVQTYTDTDVEGDAVARALNRRDSLSADGRRELDGIVRRNGNDGVEFATESDSETFDAVVRPCRATGVLSVGGTGRLQAGRLYAVEQQTRALVQSDDCTNLPDNVDDNLDDALARSDRDFDDDTVQNIKASISELDRDAQDSAIELVEAADTDGVRLINDLDDAGNNALQSFLTADIDGANMGRWRSSLARQSADQNSPVVSEDVAQYARDVREIQRIVNNDDSTEIKNPERLVQEMIQNPEGGQILGQQFEARRTISYARNNNEVTVEPNTPGANEPDLQVRRASSNDIYIENKVVVGNLNDGLTLKDKIVEADGSFDGISNADDEVIEISAQGEITNDFNPATAEQETPRESFKQLVQAQRDPTENDVGLPDTISDFENPDMTVRVIDQDGNVVEGGEFSIKTVYQEV